MKKTVNFRFGEEVHAALNELARISATPRTHILEGLVLAEHARVMGGGGSLVYIAGDNLPKAKMAKGKKS